MRNEQFGITERLEVNEMTKEFIMVQVGEMWTRNKYTNEFPSPELTDDFRYAIQYKERKGFPPPRYPISLARKHAKKYGGKIVRVRLSVEPYELEEEVE